MIDSTRALACLFLATAIAGCGGGGDGVGSSAAPGQPPAATPATPLVLDVQNARSVAILSIGLGEAVLSVAQFAVDSTRQFALPGVASPLVKTCPNGGLITITLTDRDADGTASAGDHVNIDARDCGVPVLTDIVNGVLDIDLTATTGLPPRSLRGAVTLGSGLRFGAASTTSVSLLGSMRLEWSQSDVQTALRLLVAPADDLRIVVSDGVSSVTESIRQPDLAKTLNYDAARSIIQLSYRYESQAFFGSVVVATPDPLRAYLNTYPEAGGIVITGAGNSRLTVTPNFSSNSELCQIALDLDGNGTADFTDLAYWADSTVGYFWWDGTTPLNWGSAAIPARAFATTDFFSATTLTWDTAATASLRLQFSRPLAGATASLYFRFADRGPTPYDDTPFVDVAATSERQGALVIVRPAQPLEHSHYYLLQVSRDGVEWFNGVTLQDTLGNSSSSPQWPLDVLTPDNVRAAAIAPAAPLLSPTDRATLDAGGSTTSLRRITGYQWTQLSGTPLQFGDPSAALTTVAWGSSPPNGVEDAVVQLMVTDAAGDSDTTRITIRSGNVNGSGHVLYFRSTAGDYVGNGRTVLIGDGTGAFNDSPLSRGYTRTFYSDFRNSGFTQLLIASSDGSALHAGAYEDAIRTSFHGTQNGIEFIHDGRTCNAVYGRFDVLEVEFDATGSNITRFAVDFEQHCESASAPPLFGSYRINSTIPIRR
jgi:hypothetical protein